jgi:hypothetical protein
MSGMTDMSILERRDPVDGEESSSWRATFLGALEASGNVSASARRAGVGRATVYRHRAGEADFRESWDEALEVACDALEAEARRRALDGWDEPVFYEGKVCGHIRKYSDALIMFLLKAYRPQFRDHALTEHAVNAPVQVEVRYVNDWRDSPAVAGDRSERPEEGIGGIEIFRQLGYVRAVNPESDPASNGTPS